MPCWTHLVRFVAEEDDQVHLGQLVDTSRDVGQDTVNKIPITAYLILGDIFNGVLTDKVYTVKKVCLWPLALFPGNEGLPVLRSSLLSPGSSATTFVAWV